MQFLFGRFRGDVAAWKDRIRADREAHHEAGLTFLQAWTNADDPQEIFFLFEVEDLATARSFLEDAGALDKEKQARGEIPALTFLDPA